MKTQNIIGVGIVCTLLFIGVVLLTGCTIGEEKQPENEDCPECENCSGMNRIYDVNRDGKINFQDCGKAWIYISNRYETPTSITSIIPPIFNDIHLIELDQNIKYNMYAELLYDVNIDGVANYDDVLSIWEHRD